MMTLHFLHPAWLWLLILLPLLWLVRLWSKPNNTHWHSIVDPELAPFVLSGQEKRGRILPLLVFSLIAALAIIAMAGPAWQKAAMPVFRQQQAVVVALDLSSSMYARDLKPSRLDRARFKLIDFLQLRKDGQTGLVVFAGDTFIVSPLSDDIRTIEAQMKGLSPDIMPVQGSSLQSAVLKSLNLLQQAGVSQGTILAFTDGAEDMAASRKAVQQAKQAGFNVSILAFGTAEGAPIPLRHGGFLKDSQGQVVMPKLDSAALSSLAQLGGGQFMEATLDDQDIQVLNRRLQSMGSAADQLQDGAGRKIDHWVNEGIWLVVLILPLALLLFRRGWLAVLAVFVLLPQTQTVEASIWTNLWYTSDQQGQAAMANGDVEQAQHLFKDKDWRAAAAYKAGNYELAAELYSQSENPESLYNYGNVLARQGKYPLAISVYERVLMHDPQHEDARYNLELLKKQQEQQQEQQKAQQQASSSESSQQQNQSSGENEQTGESNQGDHQQQEPETNTSEAEQAQKQEQALEEQQPAEQNNAEQSSEEAETPQKAEAQAMSQQELEKQQATEQWLRRIPDDPAGLWRRKFLYQYRQKGGSQPSGGQAW
ncbi:MAG: hypothetical protein CR991_09240 [Proteobacteria bacterium]|nr:MAG: hypothetical protein CR991_09240 [Pseudomonadota bacterium]